MRAVFLGDANDHLKGSLHAVLRNAKAISNLHVIPMETDDWSSDHRAAYARLLGLVDVEHVVSPGQFPALRRRRSDYFATARSRLPVGSDLLIDPDTGIRSSSASRAHVLVSELAAFAHDAPERLLVVYDESHDRRVTKQRHVELLAEELQREIGPTVAYEAGRSLTLFLTSRSAERIEHVHRTLESFLGPARSGRVQRFSLA